MRNLLMAALFGVFFLSGCASQEESVSNETEMAQQGDQAESDMNQGQQLSEDPVSPIAGSDAEMQALQEETLTAQELLDEPDSPLATRIIYFDYDSAKVSDDSLGLLESHGNFIAGNGNVSVRLEGHADERGSREYNVALGDRRAQSVRRILLFQGASSDQLESISYGEEKPAVFGHEESSWSKNRRVELVYEVK